MQLVIALLLLCLQLSAGKRLSGHSTSFCLIQTDGQVYCAGNNARGNLGLGFTSNDVNTPSKMRYVTHATDVCSSDIHTCIVDGGVAKCTGGNSEVGQLGIGNRDDTSTLTVLSALSNVQEIFCGRQSGCATLVSGGVRCWGDNKDGAMGQGDSHSPQTSPVTPIGFGSIAVSDIGLGYSHSCFLKATGQVWCQGYNQYGQVGDGGKGKVYSPFQVINPVRGLNMVSIACGELHSCASSSGGAMYCWGSDRNGQIGHGTTSDKENSPATVNGLTTNVAFVWASGDASFAVKTDGSAMSVGENTGGALGDGSTTTKSSAGIFASNAKVIVEIRGGKTTTCVLMADDTVRCLGLNGNGQFGTGGTTSSPTLVTSPYPQTPPPPTNLPTVAPTKQPTVAPTKAPTKQPTEAPTKEPTTLAPTVAPTLAPTTQPTKQPTQAPTKEPTEAPTKEPTTLAPTVAPTTQPTKQPTQAPTKEPTEAPTKAPTEAPTKEPTKAPAIASTPDPTKQPTETPTKQSTEAPTKQPTETPTKQPTAAPVVGLTPEPTKQPTEAQQATAQPAPPSRSPTLAPSTLAPTLFPGPPGGSGGDGGDGDSTASPSPSSSSLTESPVTPGNTVGESNKDNGGVDTSALVGALIGALLGALIFAGCFYLCCRRRTVNHRHYGGNVVGSTTKFASDSTV